MFTLRHTEANHVILFSPTILYILIKLALHKGLTDTLFIVTIHLTICTSHMNLSFNIPFWEHEPSIAKMLTNLQHKNLLSRETTNKSNRVHSDSACFSQSSPSSLVSPLSPPLQIGWIYVFTWSKSHHTPQKVNFAHEVEIFAF